MANFVRLKADIKYKTVYRCTACGAGEVGDTVATSFDGESVAELTAFMEAQQQRSHDMPVGWSYNGTFKCGDCK